jgi:hypothetical protein
MKIKLANLVELELDVGGLSSWVMRGNTYMNILPRLHQEGRCTWDLATFRIGEAADMAGLTQNRINQWVQRGLITPFIPAGPQQSCSEWRLIEVIQLKIIKSLVDAGFRLEPAAKIAKSAAETYWEKS